MNLLTETKRVLFNRSKSLDDVVWIGCDEFRISLEQFEKLANVEYDDGFGGQEVAKDLIVVGKDFWLERHEYDGSEWWEYKEVPDKPKELKEIKTLFTGDWSYLSNQPEEGEED